VVKFVFYPSKLQKTTFFANNFKIQGDLGPPSDAHDHKKRYLFRFIYDNN